MSLTAKEVDDAWGVLGATTAGRNAREKLLSILTGIAPSRHVASALSEHEGKRILALELLQLMDVSVTSGRDDTRSADAYPRPKREPIGYAASRSLRRVPDADPGDGQPVNG